jgi:recombination protein RecT
MAVLTDGSGQIQSLEQRKTSIEEVLHGDGVRKALNDVLPKAMDLPRFTRIALSTLKKNQDLAQCDSSSFFNALLQSAVLGLEPNTPMGHSYLIPYGRECTLVVGYQGFIDLAYRSGAVTDIHANVVRPGDEFDWAEGTAPFITHKPLAIPKFHSRSNQKYLTGEDTTHAYAYARLLSGGHVQVVMLKEEIDAIRSRSSTANKGPWVTDPVAMQKKTAIRQLRKFLPMSAQGRAFHMAAGIDDLGESGLAQVFDVPDLVAIHTETSRATVVKQDEKPDENGSCPVHDSPWVMGKYGFQHEIEGSQPREWCKPGSAAVRVAAANGMDEQQLNDWLRERYDITRSKIEPEQLAAFYAEISPKASTTPTAESEETAMGDIEGVIVVADDAQAWPE